MKSGSSHAQVANCLPTSKNANKETRGTPNVWPRVRSVLQACRTGLLQHLEHLLFYGADMNARNASGNTPLHVCAVNSQESCARQLLFRGADTQALNYANQTPYQVAVIAGNMELAETIQNYRHEDVGEWKFFVDCLHLVLCGCILARFDRLFFKLLQLDREDFKSFIAFSKSN